MWCRVGVGKPPGPEIGRDVGHDASPPPVNDPKTLRAQARPLRYGLHEAGQIGNQTLTMRELKRSQPIRDPLQVTLLNLELLDCSTARGRAIFTGKWPDVEFCTNLAEHGQFMRITHGSLTISCAGIRERVVIESRASSMMPQGSRGAPVSPYVSISSRSSLCAVFCP